MTDPTPTITCFVQTNMVGMSYGDIVTLTHTPYVDALIAGGRLVPDTDPIFTALVAENQAQPTSWDLLATAAGAASPETAVTPSTAALNEAPVTDAATPVDAPVVAPVDAPVDSPAPAA